MCTTFSICHLGVPLARVFSECKENIGCIVDHLDAKTRQNGIFFNFKGESLKIKIMRLVFGILFVEN